MKQDLSVSESKVSIKDFTTDAEIILAYLEGRYPREKLGPKMLEKLDRITQAKSWLMEHKFQYKVVELMMNTYGYSDATAYRDLKLMSRVFGPIMQVHKDLKRAIADRMIADTWTAAVTKKDLKTQSNLIKNYIQLHQLDKEDPELPDVSDFEFHNIIVAVLPEQVGQNPPSEEELSERLSAWWESQAEEVKAEEE
jgi:CO dehydrogenase/acetyl-CoA synthase alpha subunit